MLESFNSNVHIMHWLCVDDLYTLHHGGLVSYFLDFSVVVVVVVVLLVAERDLAFSCCLTG